jgi:hypothetical protein
VKKRENFCKQEKKMKWDSETLQLALQVLWFWISQQYWNLYLWTYKVTEVEITGQSQRQRFCISGKSKSLHWKKTHKRPWKHLFLPNAWLQPIDTLEIRFLFGGKVYQQSYSTEELKNQAGICLPDWKKMKRESTSRLLH